MLRKPSTILVLAPHTDDGEIGAGGSLARWVEEGHTVHYVAMSGCEASVPTGLPPETLRIEVLAATASLGIPRNHVKVLDYAVRQFVSSRQEILESLLRLRDEIAPDLVLCPSLHDFHQDHEVVAREAVRAFKHSSIIGYEIPWNQVTFPVSTFVHLDQRHLDCKLAALMQYESQRGRPYMDASATQAAARFRGLQAGCTFAEAFEPIRIHL